MHSWKCFFLILFSMRALSFPYITNTVNCLKLQVLLTLLSEYRVSPEISLKEAAKA